jgi:uncharacterized Fe-S radical SAM superfamily protein PflX
MKVLDLIVLLEEYVEDVEVEIMYKYRGKYKHAKLGQINHSSSEDTIFLTIDETDSKYFPETIQNNLKIKQNENN